MENNIFEFEKKYLELSTYTFDNPVFIVIVLPLVGPIIGK